MNSLVIYIVKQKKAEVLATDQKKRDTKHIKSKDNSNKKKGREI